MKRLNRILHFENLDLLGIGVALFCLSLFVYALIPLLVFYLFKVRRSISMMLFWVMASLIGIGYYVLITDDIPHEVSDVAKVIKIDHRDTYDSIILKIKGRKYITYTSNELFQVGDEVYVEAEVTVYPKQTVPLGFNQHT